MNRQRAILKEKVAPSCSAVIFAMKGCRTGAVRRKYALVAAQETVLLEY
ncbi:hypothetical protein KAU37_13040 [Candidatus Bipolaricaulota bacterium]|nr:hypothetical protein [Candidatus Bipolaricaulota bacterium]